MLEITENKSSFSDSALVRMVKRDNNSKRNYLLVNNIQGKHIPADPSDVLKLFSELASQVKEKYKDQKILFIGFAETATAVGAGVASHFENSYYIHTTREARNDIRPVAEFKEEHSHSVEQLLYCENWNYITSKVDRIIFVEDEITTGKTILNFINELKTNKKTRADMPFSVCSILNGMTEERRKELFDNGLDFIWLVRHYAAPDSDCVYINEDVCLEMKNNTEYKLIEKDGMINPRLGTYTAAYIQGCKRLSESIIENIPCDKKRIAVIGTEECMYPAIFTASEISKKSADVYVRTHSSTRSPIVADRNDKYPIKLRCQVESLYELGRKSYIYNTDEEYDLVIIVTDSDRQVIQLDGFVSAFSGCSDFVLVRWSGK